MIPYFNLNALIKQGNTFILELEKTKKEAYLKVQSNNLKEPVEIPIEKTSELYKFLTKKTITVECIFMDNSYVKNAYYEDLKIPVDDIKEGIPYIGVFYSKKIDRFDENTVIDELINTTYMVDYFNYDGDRL